MAMNKETPIDNQGDGEKIETVNDDFDPAMKEHLDNVSEQISHAARLGGKKHEANAALEEQQAEIARLKDALLRLAAEKENMTKRLEKQISDTGKYAISSFLKDLLPAIDNLYRASESISPDALAENQQLKMVFDGIEITKKDFSRVFEKHSLIRIEPKSGDDFDHNFHQAVATIPETEVADGKIVSVMQAGYELSGRLIRAAMVTVAKKG